MKSLTGFFDAISPLKEKTWEELLPLFKETALSANEYFVRENEVARKIAFLESGVVRAFFINQEGQEYNKQFFVGPSSIGGYTSLLTGKANLIPQQALTDCKICSCDFRSLTDRYDQYPDLERLARKMAEYYFLEKEKKELEIVLLDASQRYRIFQKEFPTLEQLIPQYHIASYLGISATQLSRIRHQFANK
ncbi:MAG: Crp/Fnr family transcriptional regulator [Chitinophagaceae bacterium]